mgnify:CR=1 FL=1
MKAKEAVAAAKKHLIEIFSGEDIEPPTLEEVWLDNEDKTWAVTFAVRRKRSALSVTDRLGLRDLKVVRISDKDGSVVAIRDQFRDRS